MPSVTRAENAEEDLSNGETRISLRVKIPVEGGTAVVEMTGPPAPENGLQVFGDWVLAALEQHADGADEGACLIIVALRERDWEGDDVLADQLDALLGSGAIPDLRPLPVDLDQLVRILEGDPMYGGGRVDLATGEVWPEPAIDYAREIGQEDEDESGDPDKWLWVHPEGSRDGYRDMELFIGTVRDPGRADRLGDRHFRTRSVPAVQGRPRSLARRTRSVVCVFRGASAWPGQGLAGRRRLLRPQGAPSILTQQAFRPVAHRRDAMAQESSGCPCGPHFCR